MPRPIPESNLQVDCKRAYMRKSCLLLCILSFITLSSISQRTITDFDLDWKFIQSDVPDAETAQFNDATWRSLRVPHDWMIEGPYDRNNPTNRGGGYLPSGIGWYRKTFTIPTTEANKKVSIEFDGVMANSEVWLNGKSLGKRPYGYISFAFDLTPYLYYGKPNIIAVRADNLVQPASRYYTGAGIYRHTRLISTNPVHFDHWGYLLPLQKYRPSNPL